MAGRMIREDLSDILDLILCAPSSQLEVGLRRTQEGKLIWYEYREIAAESHRKGKEAPSQRILLERVAEEGRDFRNARSIPAKACCEEPLEAGRQLCG